mmetsp:Transcript_76072/g.219678  ORF Transcript_76072/g.219678 Transcript_76072/m.219678 type:complete len:209 (+) Transcript_76072:329-955(+)
MVRVVQPAARGGRGRGARRRQRPGAGLPDVWRLHACEHAAVRRPSLAVGGVLGFGLAVQAVLVVGGGEVRAFRSDAAANVGGGCANLEDEDGEQKIAPPDRDDGANPNQGHALVDLRTRPVHVTHQLLHLCREHTDRHEEFGPIHRRATMPDIWIGQASCEQLIGRFGNIQLELQVDPACACIRRNLVLHPPKDGILVLITVCELEPA